MINSRPLSEAVPREDRPTGFLTLAGMMVTSVLVLAAIGPLNTLALPEAPRIAYWLAVMAGSALILGFAEWVFLTLLPVANRQARVFLLTVSAAPLQILVVMGANFLAFAEPASRAQFVSLIPPVLAGCLFIIILLEGLRLAAAQRRSERTQADAGEHPTPFTAMPMALAAAAAAPQNSLPAQPVEHTVPERATSAARSRMPKALAKRLPAKKRDAALIALEAQDHYVRIHTAAGSEVVLMRFSDAIAEAEQMIPGYRLHRSWWARETALKDVDFKRGSGKAALEGGLSAPVSRTYYPALRKAGWS